MCAFMLSEKMIFKEKLTTRISSLLFVLHLFSEIGETFACKGYFVRGKDYQQRGLILHNIYRKHHGAPAMELTDKLNWIADKCAKNYARRGTIDHKCPYLEKVPGGRPGENLWWSSATKNINPVASSNSAVRGFYSEIKNYNFIANQGNKDTVTGHFTQLVWDTSTKLGIGFALNDTSGNFIVALYEEHGNVQGEGMYKKHVYPPKGPSPKIRDIE